MENRWETWCFLDGFSLPKSLSSQILAAAACGSASSAVHTAAEEIADLRESFKRTQAARKRPFSSMFHRFSSMFHRFSHGFCLFSARGSGRKGLFLGAAVGVGTLPGPQGAGLGEPSEGAEQQPGGPGEDRQGDSDVDIAYLHHILSVQVRK